MLALFAEPSGATFYLEIQEPLPTYHVPSYNAIETLWNESSLMKPRTTVKTYKLVGLSYVAEPTIAFYDREL